MGDLNAVESSAAMTALAPEGSSSTPSAPFTPTPRAPRSGSPSPRPSGAPGAGSTTCFLVPGQAFAGTVVDSRVVVDAPGPPAGWQPDLAVRPLRGAGGPDVFPPSRTGAVGVGNPGSLGTPSDAVRPPTGLTGVGAPPDGEPGSSLERRAGRKPEFLYLTTTGRRTGLPREIEIWFTRRAGRAYLVAETGERAHWVRNLRADPRVRWRVGSRRDTGRARVVDPVREAALAAAVRARFEAVRLGRRPDRQLARAAARSRG